VSNNPGNSLSDDLFRAIPAAAMTRLMADRSMSREAAARDIARRLSKMGCKDSAGKSIAASQISRWREKMMTELASKNRAVARYKLALELVNGMDGAAAATFLLDSLLDLSPSGFPKNPPA
jgi:hypothetical protein